MQVTALSKECSNFMVQAEEGCPSAETLTTLQTYQERLDGEFSARHFQALKAKACAMGVGSSQVKGVWNAAWVQSQEVKQRLEEMQKKTKKKGVDKKQIQQAAAATPSGKLGETNREEERSEPGGAESPLILPQKEVNKTLESPKGSVACCKHNKTEIKETKSQDSKVQTQAETAPKTPVLPQIGDVPPESKWRSREHHSEADLRSFNSAEDAKLFSLHQKLGRSLSEGTCVIDLSGLSPVNRSHKHCHSKKLSLDQNLKPTQNLRTYHHVSLRTESQNCGPKTEEEEKGSSVSAKNREEFKTSEILLTPAESNDNNVL